MAALAPEPPTAEPMQDYASEVAHAQEAIAETASDISASAFETADEIAANVASLSQSVDHSVPEVSVAPEPDSLPTLTVPTLVGGLTTPQVPRITALQFGAESFGTTVMSYVVGEGEAFAAHMRALAGARSMADFVRLQIGEFQRAADATLTCWGRLTVSASRTAVAR